MSLDVDVSRRVVRDDASGGVTLGSTAVPASLSARAAFIVLAGVFCLSAGLQAAVASRIPAIWIVPDELIYSELAKGIASEGVPRIRDDTSLAFGVGYPLLLAPIWAIFDDIAAVYAAAKVLNAVLLSVTVVPAYFLARRFIGGWQALAVAGLTVSVPSMLYAGTLLTEVALYPAFVAALLGIAVAVEKSTLAAQALAVGAIVLAASVKMLALALVVAYVAAVLLFHWLDTRDARLYSARLRKYAATWVVLASAAAILVLLPLFSGGSPGDLLGSYSVVLRNVDVLAVPWWFVVHIAELDLYLAILPMVTSALVVVRGFRRVSTQRDRLYAALAVPTVLVVVLVVAAYSSKAHAGAPGYFASDARIHERATFVLAPLFLLGLIIWLADRAGWAPLLAVACLIGALLPPLLPLEDTDGNVRFQALALVPWREHVDSGFWSLGLLVYGALLAALALIAARSRWPAALLIVPVVVSFAVVSVAAHASMSHAAEWTRSAAAGSNVNWVDRAIGPREQVSVLWYEPNGEGPVRLEGRHRILFVGEFFNRSIGTVFELGSQLPYELPSVPVRLDNESLVLRDGRPAPVGRFVLVPCHVAVIGRSVARDRWTGARIVEVREPVRVAVADPLSCEHVPEF